MGETTPSWYKFHRTLEGTESGPYDKRTQAPWSKLDIRQTPRRLPREKNKNVLVRSDLVSSGINI
jgi:hypothetical protein